LGQIISQSELILQRENWKGNEQNIVFVSGCFDLLHPGHVRLLEQARSYGDKLVVGVQSDAGVRASQARHGLNDGSSRADARPITPSAERAEILSELAAVDYVVEYGEPDATALIDALHPEIVVEAGQADGQATGGHVQFKVIRIQKEPGYSTEQLLSRIVQRPA
jgi:D-beta-D-heptose 7-phosphate kinase/D-beta-D-heptose 1-phosphate adenosyltransferase